MVPALPQGQAYPALYTTCGIHPCMSAALWRLDADATGPPGRHSQQQQTSHFAGLYRPSPLLDRPQAYLAALLATAEQGRGVVVALGEMGLDYDRLRWSPARLQTLAFQAQLQHVAAHASLPLFLHNRNCGDELVPGLDAAATAAEAGRFRGVVHSFTGTRAELDRFLAAGLYIGINGCSFKARAAAFWLFVGVYAARLDGLVVLSNCLFSDPEDLARGSQAGPKCVSRPDLAGIKLS